MLFSRKPLLLLASCLWTCTAQSVNAVHSVKNRTISVGNETFVINPTHVVVESHAIVPGGAALTVNGHPVSVDSGHDLFVGTLEVITAAATATTRGPINTVPAFRNSSIPLGTGLPGTEITSSGKDAGSEERGETERTFRSTSVSNGLSIKSVAIYKIERYDSCLNGEA